jgi:hypothetical protein
MTHFPQANGVRRSPRVQLNGSVGAAIHAEGGLRDRAKLQTLSMTGGLLELPQPLAAGDFVEISFHTMAGGVYGMAEMLPPTQKFQSACLQPFRFIAIGDDDNRRLRMCLASARERIFIDPATSLPKPASGL